MKFVSELKCPYPASLWSLRSRGTWSTWNTGVTLKIYIYIDTWSEHQTGVSKQENRHDQSDMEYYSSNECIQSCNLRRVPVSRRLLDHPLDQIHKIHLQDLPTKIVEHTELYSLSKQASMELNYAINLRGLNDHRHFQTILISLRWWGLYIKIGGNGKIFKLFGFFLY